MNNRYSEIKLLNFEINNHFINAKREKVRGAAQGASVNLWRAVGLARGLVQNEIPTDLTLDGMPVPRNSLANSFGEHFSSKVKRAVGGLIIDQNNVYNGKCKMLVQNRNFMEKKMYMNAC